MHANECFSGLFNKCGTKNTQLNQREGETSGSFDELQSSGAPTGRSINSGVGGERVLEAESPPHGVGAQFLVCGL